MRDENGLEKCVACGLCAVACPADAIYLEAAENDGTVQAGPRYAKVYQIHKTRCIFCGYCEEACPVSAIFMGKDYELAVYSNKDFIWDKKDLLVPAATCAEGVIRRRACALRRQARALTVFGALGDIHGDFDAASARSWRGIPTCRSGCASATSPTMQGRYEPVARRSTGSRATTRTSTRSRPATLPPIAASSSTNGTRRRTIGGAARRRARRHVRADVVPDAGRRAAAPAQGHRAGDRAGRQAPALRARGSRALQGAARHRRVPDARGAAAVSGCTAGAGPMPGRRRSTRCSPRCSRGCTSSAIIIGSVEQERQKASARSGSTWSPRSYLLIDRGDAAVRADTLKRRCSSTCRPHSSRSSTSACSSATARWGRCCTRAASSSTARSTS